MWFDLTREKPCKFLADYTNVRIFPSLTALSGLRYMEQSSSEFLKSSHLKHAVFCKLKPGVFVLVVSTEQTLRMLSPATLSKSSGGAPGSGAPGYGAPCYGRTWAHLIAFSRCGLKLFFRVTPSCVYIAESTKKRTAVSPAPFSLASSTARRSAVRCRAVPCFAVLSLSYITDDNAR